MGRILGEQGRGAGDGGQEVQRQSAAHAPANVVIGKTLTKTGVRFRNEMEVGPAGRQIQLEDPDGNPVELFEPTR